jgi:hypothetical protein
MSGIWSIAMPKKAKPGKVNRAITVDADLDRRMKKADDVNWSAVASAAFERELSLRDRRKVMSNTIERMRLQNEEDQEETFVEGQEWGQDWAKDFARPKELRRLARWRAGWGYDYLRVTIDAEDVIAAIQGHSEHREVDVAEWFREIGDETSSHEDEDWVRGFVKGALEVWADIEPQL